jgi:hypothetical protein
MAHELLRFAGGGDTVVAQHAPAGTKLGDLRALVQPKGTTSPCKATRRYKGYKGREQTLTQEREAELVQIAGNGVSKVAWPRSTELAGRRYQYLRQAKPA